MHHCHSLYLSLGACHHVFCCSSLQIFLYPLSLYHEETVSVDICTVSVDISPSIMFSMTPMKCCSQNLPSTEHQKCLLEPISLPLLTGHSLSFPLWMQTPLFPILDLWRDSFSLEMSVLCPSPSTVSQCSQSFCIFSFTLQSCSWVVTHSIASGFFSGRELKKLWIQLVDKERRMSLFFCPQVKHSGD